MAFCDVGMGNGQGVELVITRLWVWLSAGSLSVGYYLDEWLSADADR